MKNEKESFESWAANVKKIANKGRKAPTTDELYAARGVLEYLAHLDHASKETTEFANRGVQVVEDALWNGLMDKPSN